MTYKKKIIKFMSIMADILECFDIQPQLYFNKYDKDNICGWKRSQAKRIWKWVLSEIQYETHGSKVILNPFCLYSDIYSTGYCDDCKYSFGHLECKNTYSDFSLVQDMLNLKKLSFCRLFNNGMYKDIIGQISNRDYKKVLVKKYNFFD